MPQAKPQFYAVWGLPRGSSVTSVFSEHGSVQEAVTRAEQLAEQYRGCNFYVLKAIKVSSINGVRTEDLQPQTQAVPWVPSSFANRE